MVKKQEKFGVLLDGSYRLPTTSNPTPRQILETEAANLKLTRDKETKQMHANIRKNKKETDKRNALEQIRRGGFDANAYSTLGVPARASQQDIRSAYKKLSLKFHPDKNPNGRYKFVEIKNAYDTLQDKSAKKLVHKVIPRAKPAKKAKSSNIVIV